MFRSIRWTLQLWHAGILLLALTSFGVALDVAMGRAQLRRVDAELEGAAQVLANGPMGPPHPPGNDPRGNGFPPFGGDHQPGFNGNGPPRGPDGRGPNGDQGPLDNRPHFPPQDWWTTVPQDALRRLGENEQDQPYFVIWGADGDVLRSSSPSPTVPFDADLAKSFAASGANGIPQFRQRAGFREVVLPGPFGMSVLVGKSMFSEQATLARLHWQLFGAGAAVLFVGLLGGWFLSRRVMRPIQQISETARSISASDLSQRIEVAETEGELGSLAKTLNETFQRLQTAFERQVQFTADASHELRTPLSVIHSHTELALNKERTAAEYKQTLATSLRAAQRMKSLVESLLVLARADAGKWETQTEKFNLQSLAEECVAMIAPRAAEKNVTMAKDLTPVEMDTDRTRLAQLLTNLLANAVQYNREGGRVELKVVPVGSEVLITVADSGVGIAEDDQPHIFERFFRTDKARSREAGGSGLGLAICQSIVKTLGGTISFRSQLGEGTTFELRLPRSGPKGET